MSGVRVLIRRFRVGRWLAASAVLGLVTVVAGGAAGIGDPAGLAGLHEVSLAVDLVHPLDGLAAEDLRARLEETLRATTPVLALVSAAADRIRLTVDVRPVSATALRGFWLPFSGTYGIGAVRLGVERTVTLPDAPERVSAVVWQTERTVAGPWRSTGAEIMRSVEAMAAELLRSRTPPR